MAGHDAKPKSGGQGGDTDLEKRLQRLEVHLETIAGAVSKAGDSFADQTQAPVVITETKILPRAARITRVDNQTKLILTIENMRNEPRDVTVDVFFEGVPRSKPVDGNIPGSKAISFTGRAVADTTFVLDDSLLDTIRSTEARAIRLSIDFEFEDGSHVTRLLNVDVPYERSPVEWNTPVMG